MHVEIDQHLFGKHISTNKPSEELLARFRNHRYHLSSGNEPVYVVDQDGMLLGVKKKSEVHENADDIDVVVEVIHFNMHENELSITHSAKPELKNKIVPNVGEHAVAPEPILHTLGRAIYEEAGFTVWYRPIITMQDLPPYLVRTTEHNHYIIPYIMLTNHPRSRKTFEQHLARLVEIDPTTDVDYYRENPFEIQNTPFHTNSLYKESEISDAYPMPRLQIVECVQNQDWAEENTTRHFQALLNQFQTTRFDAPLANIEKQVVRRNSDGVPTEYDFR